ncbi:sigma-70 family RNA polymerase sigma factor [Streptomyces sp. NPDC088789]|uniref:sigma-70 family RNA polymerase sigma factor n=1 Tax=Streptomyces sp. NPDC088789 TaxID=3365899 RepID=UPI00382C67A1
MADHAHLAERAHPADHAHLAERAQRFEAHRGRLRSVAHRILGSLAEADDAVQETWLRYSRSDTARIDNLGGWLTTVTGRLCLDMLRSRNSRAEDSLDASLDAGMPAPAAPTDPEQDALLADSVGAALLVVLETLTPAERLAFVLHDMFAVPYDDVAVIVDRTPTAVRQLASRARRRVRGAPEPDGDLVRQRAVVQAFLTAAREGDFDGLLAVLDPDAVARTGTGVNAGAVAVARGASSAGPAAGIIRHAYVDGATGIAVVSDSGQPLRTLSFTFVGDRIAVIEIVSEPERLAALAVELV